MMLVLSREAGETIQIGENITITVKSVKGGRCQIAIDAPREIRVMRKEIYEREHSTNNRA